jgi:hypothetical protein
MREMGQGNGPGSSTFCLIGFAPKNNACVAPFPLQAQLNMIARSVFSGR